MPTYLEGNYDDDDDISSLGEEQSALFVDVIQNEDDSSQDSDDVEKSLHKIKLNLFGSQVGRNKEFQILKEAFQRVRSEAEGGGGGKSELVVIAGKSGTGKSTLVEAMRATVSLEANGFQVSGKFDQLRNEPFFAIVEAFSDLSDLVAQERTQQEKERILSRLRREFKILIKLVPNLSRLASGTSYEGEIQNLIHKTAASKIEVSKDAFARFKLSCRRFIRAMASPQHPVLVFLDDLQWADEASIKVLRSLVTDDDSRNVLFVCSYRSNLDRYSESMMELIEFLQTCSHSADTDGSEQSGTFDAPPLPVIMLELDDLDLRGVNEMVASILRVHQARTTELSELIHRRTNGNPYFIAQFLTLLETSNLLVFVPEQDTWQWDLSKIQSETSASDNVAALLNIRVQKAPKHVQLVLKVAACLGYKFERSLLHSVVSSLPASVLGANFADALIVAEDSGLIERDNHRKTMFSFTHDRVHQCLYSMVSATSEDRANLHLQIAEAMQSYSKRMDSGDTLTCSIADQLNRARDVLHRLQYIEAAQANLDAARVAITKSAISLGSQYTEEGLAYFQGAAPWTDHYDLVLNLYSTAVEVYFGTGRLADCKKVVKEIVQNAKCLDDRLFPQLTFVAALGSEGEFRPAVELALDLVRELGYDIPQKPGFYHLIVEYMRTRKLVRGKSDEELLTQIPNEYLGRTLDRLLGYAAQYAGLGYMLPHLCVSILKLFQWSVTESRALPPAYASYGIILAVFNDKAGVKRFGRLSLELLEKQDSRHLVPPTYPLIHMYFNYMNAPLRDSLEPLHRAYHIGMETGQVDEAFSAIEAYVVATFHCGICLDDVERVHRMFCRQMIEFEHRGQAIMCLPFWQLSMNLMGMSDVPNILSGEAMDVEKLRQEAIESKHLYAQLALTMARIILSYILGDTHTLAKLLREMEPVQKFGSQFHSFLGCFYVSVGSLAVHRSQPNKRFYLRKARRMLQALQKHEKNGCPDSVPLARLAEAELYSLNKRRHLQVQELYNEAILEAHELGLGHIEALANEKAGLFFLSRGQPHVAANYLKTSLNHYEEWGSPVKAHQLMARVPSKTAPEDASIPPSAVTAAQSS